MKAVLSTKILGGAVVRPAALFERNKIDANLI